MTAQIWNDRGWTTETDKEYFKTFIDLNTL
jgi:hypothetical protein